MSVASLALPYWLSRKITTIAVASFVFASGLFFLSFSLPSPHASLRSPTLAKLDSLPEQKVTECSDNWHYISPAIWNAAKAKSDDFLDDKFTYEEIPIRKTSSHRADLTLYRRIVIQTFRRPRILDRTIEALIAEHVPSLLELHVVWNDQLTLPPKDFMSAHNVSVKFRHTTKNSINEKFRPIPAYRTKAILLHDDDVYYHPKDMEFAFQTWRKQGRDRIVGAFARTHTKSDDGQWVLGMTHDSYSVIMTGLAFVHVSFLEYWWSEDPLMKTLREYVDQLVNCDDIAMNFLVSTITCQPPLQVNGLLPPSNEEPKIAISQSAGHGEKRLRCMRELPELFGCMPLTWTTTSVKHGQFPW